MQGDVENNETKTNDGFEVKKETSCGGVFATFSTSSTKKISTDVGIN